MPKKNTDDAKVLCLTPTPGKQGTRIDAWKYNAVRKAILKALGRGRAGVEFRDLPELVSLALSKEDAANLGSVMWYTTTVKLHMETEGEIERVPGAKPQRVRRVITK